LKLTKQKEQKKMYDENWDNPEWQALHYTLEHDGGFVHYYYRLNDLIGYEVKTDCRTYKISLYDIMILQYLIGYQKKKNTCCFEKRETIMRKLNVKYGTLLDSLIKWKTLNIIVEHEIPNTRNRTTRMYVDIPYLLEFLGYQVDIEKAQENYLKEQEDNQKQSVQEDIKKMQNYEGEAEEMF
jgi:hypothetical protein